MGTTWKHVVKRRVHLERVQPLNRRKKYQYLEKHDDYVKRARAYQTKRAERAKLQEDARQRNPDEYRRGMEKGRLDEKGRYTAIEKPLEKEEVLNTNNANRRVITLKKAQLLKAMERQKALTPMGLDDTTISALKEDIRQHDLALHELEDVRNITTAKGKVKIVRGKDRRSKFRLFQAVRQR